MERWWKMTFWVIRVEKNSPGYSLATLSFYQTCLSMELQGLLIGWLLGNSWKQSNYPISSKKKSQICTCKIRTKWSSLCKSVYLLLSIENTVNMLLGPGTDDIWSCLYAKKVLFIFSTERNNPAWLALSAKRATAKQSSTQNEKGMFKEHM